MQEEIVAKVTDLQDGEMKEVEIRGLKILLTRLNGRFYAMGGECSHYGGPLAEGVLCGEHVTCPWHQARFHATTGDLVDPPALDAMTRFDARVEGENVVVTLPDKPEGRCAPRLAKHNPTADKRTLVIVGAGAAGNAAAQQLRHSGYEGRLVLISQDKELPYDRPPLSKGYLAGQEERESLTLRPAEFFRDADIELFLGREVTEIDAQARMVYLADGGTLAFDGLLLATGGIPRTLAVPGADLDSVFTLRSLSDCQAIIAAAAAASQAVVVGASFIGMEAAASLKQRGLDVTVVGPGAAPFQRTLGWEIGRLWQEIHQEQGVNFRLGKKVVRLEGSGRVEAVVLDDGQRLPADLVLVGVGVRSATDMLKGVNLNLDGSVTVDQYLAFGEGLYAAGDVARFPDWRTGELIRVEHWQLAELHGFNAAQNLAGRRVEFRGVPYFWTAQYESYLFYVGHATEWDEIVWHGTLAERRFVAFYVRDNQVLAAAGMGYDHGMAYIAELMRAGRMPAPEALRQGDAKFLAHMKM